MSFLSRFFNRIRRFEVLTKGLSDEAGMALVLALMTMTVLTIVATTSVLYSTQSQHQATFSKSSDVAYRLAEAGVNNAAATLGLPANNAQSQATLPSTEATSNSQVTSVGTSRWWGLYDALSNSWAVYGKGIVANTSAHGASIKRTVSARISVTPSLKQPLNAQAWNYWFATNQGGPSVCDTSISNNVEVDSSFYIMGNLCLSNNAKIVEDLATPRIPIIVAVQGKFNYSNGTSIGRSSTNTVTEAHINGGCGSSFTSMHTCKAYPTSGNDPIYAGTFDTNGSLVTPPVIDWAYWYAHASPGPNNPCAAGAVRAPSFDGGPAPHNTAQDITGVYPNGSVPTTFDLTPSQDYSCSTGYGSISWSALTKTLTVSGAMYIDGNVAVTNGAVNEYNGMATLYVSGSLSVNGMMCGKRNATSSDCDFSSWDPNTEMLIVGAHGSDASGNSVFLNNSAKWEGGIYGVNKDTLSNNAEIEGPTIGGTFGFSNNVVLKPFPKITVVPLGAPGNPNVYAQPNPPSGYSG
jgi:Tfp pilus assembly protein PilX